MKINLGSGSTPLDDYINVDMDSLEDLKIRYPHRKFSGDTVIKQWDIFNLPVDNDSVDEIRSECLFEHLNFVEEKAIFYEVKRVLKPGGILHLCVPDFNELVKTWINAKDDWQDWYRTDKEAIEQQHWFGQNSYSMDNKWGYTTACLFGNQHGNGQFHKNCYTLNKLKKIFDRIGFEVIQHENFMWPRGQDSIIRIIGKKLQEKTK